MPKRPSPSLRSRARARATLPGAAVVRRFARSDGRFDLPVITGRTPRQVARRLA